MFQNLYAGGVGHNGGLSDSDKQSVFDNPGDQCQTRRKRRRIGNTLERGVDDQVPAVRDKRMAFTGAAQQGGAGTTGFDRRLLDLAPDRRESERDYFDGQGKASEHVDQLGVIGNDHHPGGGRGHDLLAQQRAPAALDQAQPRADLVGSVYGKVEFRRFIKGGERDSTGVRLRPRRLRGRNPDNRQPGPHPLGQQLDKVVGGRPGPDPKPHAGFDHLQGPRCGGPLQLLDVFDVHGEAPPSIPQFPGPD